MTVLVPIYRSPHRRARRSERVLSDYALVDDLDAARVLACRWHRDNGYARSDSLYRGLMSVSMHRLVLGLTTGDPEVDHVNRDKLDNRRENLRLATRQDNVVNTPAQAGCTSRYRGVNWKPLIRKWQARAGFDGISHYLGVYTLEEDAAAAVAAFWAERSPIPLDLVADA